MPNSLQLPLERQRDLQRKWNRLFQRTVTASDGVRAKLRHPTLHHKDDARFDDLIVSFGCSNEIAPIELDAFGDRAGKLIAASSSYQPMGAGARMNKTSRQ